MKTRGFLYSKTNGKSFYIMFFSPGCLLPHQTGYYSFIHTIADSRDSVQAVYSYLSWFVVPGKDNF
jgi:hypothetical protein